MQKRSNVGRSQATPRPADETSQFIAQAFMAGHQVTIGTGGCHLRDDHRVDVCHAARADFVMRMGSDLSLPTLNKLANILDVALM